MSESPVRRGGRNGFTPLALATISAAFGGALIGRFADDTPLYALGGLVVAIGGYEIARRKTEFQETNA